MRAIELLLFIASLGFTAHLIFSLFRSEKKFLLVLFLYKPFIDQTVRFSLLRIGRTEINLLSLWGVLVFGVTCYIYFGRILSQRRRIYAQGLIRTLLAIHLLSATLSAIKGNITPVTMLEMFIRISTPYLFYFIFGLYFSDREYIQSLFKAIWLGNLSAILFTAALHRIGVGFSDISQNIVRYTGFFADSATLSLAAFSALVFAILFRENKGNPVSQRERILYYLTWGGFAYIFWISLTKATILITIALVLMWYGYFKKRTMIIFPMVLMGVVFFFKESRSAQARFTNEFALVQTIGKERIDLNQFRGVGSGRVGRWVDTIEIYKQDYSDVEKLIGTYLFHKSHNQFIGFLMLIGMIGLMVFLWSTGWLLRGMLIIYRKTRNPIVFMGIIMVTCMLLYGIGYQSFTYSGTLWMSFMLVSPINVVLRHPQRTNAMSAALAVHHEG